MASVIMIAKDLAQDRKKFLVVCEGGNCRSVALVRVLKVEHGQEAIAIGWRYTTPWVWETLGGWADYIILMEGSFIVHVPERLAAKVMVLDVGPDAYGVPTHPALYGCCQHFANEWASRSFQL